MPWVVSDSSTLIHLAHIERLALLKRLYGRVAVPPAVWREVVEQGGSRPGALEVAKARAEGWIEVVAPADETLVHLLRRDLNDGESEVIALAIERGADLTLVDESEARRVAAHYGLAKTGIVGILMRARREGLIDSLQAELDKLKAPGGFWIEDSLYHEALNAVGEE
jgi:predicted nucleic acid-binding protein